MGKITKGELKLRRYTDKSGGVVVEKYESGEVQDKTKNSTASSSIPALSAVDVIDTMISYQIPTFTNGGVGDAGTCLICGVSTAYSNRKVCVNCWKEHKDYILDSLKNAVRDIQIKG